MYISFEGIDGAGKSTIMKMVADRLQHTLPNYNIVTTNEPKGVFRDIVLDADNKYGVTELSRFFLYQADRALHTENLIEKELKKDNTVILCDRGPISTLAYQHITTGLDFKVMENIISIANKGIFPDCYMFFDVDYETSSHRLSDEKDYFDKMGKGFFEDLIYNYRTLMYNFGLREDVDIFTINANKDIDIVLELVYNTTLKYIKSKTQ